MTDDRAFKQRVRARMGKTGESYTTARANLVRHRPAPAGPPPAATVTPVFRIGSEEAAVDHYVSWLGFTLEWTWREAPGAPAILALSHHGARLMLYEEPGTPASSWITLDVPDLAADVEAWNGRRPGSVAIVVAPPYDIPTVSVRDPFDNLIDFSQGPDEDELAARSARRAAMLADVVDRRDRGAPLPTAEALVAAHGRPLGLALDVLVEAQQQDHATDGR